MDISTTRIDTLARAKEYFQVMGCSHFHMSRENFDRYEEYRNLAISEDTEREWTCEAFAQAAAKLNSRATKHSDLWRIHSEMEHLVRYLKTVESLRQIYQATEAIAPRLPQSLKVLVAETIIGRSRISYRSGLVFLAHDFSEEGISRRFSEIAAELATSSRDSGFEPERSQAALDTCVEIQKLLGFT